MTDLSPRLLVIAVVDDDEPVRKALRRLLEASNVKVASHGSGEEFLCSLAADVPDCVILDLQMTGITGFEVMEQLRIGHQHVPVIVLTGRDQTGTKERCMTRGARAYLRKPVHEASLLTAVETVTGIRLG